MAADNSAEVRRRLLKALGFAKSFFTGHGLRYVACGGTVLGAVRHKGLIPWDDDIDLYMPRRDYERLLGMSGLMKDAGYEVLSCRNNPGYYIPFAKIAELGSTVWEFERYPYVFGISIDIFPLDEFDMPDEEITVLQYRSHHFFDRYMNAVSRYSAASVWRCLVCGDWHGLGVRVLSVLRRGRAGSYLKAFLEFEASYKGGRGGKCVCVTQWEGRIFRSEWFSDVVELPFEDTTVTVPRDYDAYLTLLYGDYMTPPPESARTSHPHYFVDLDERLTLEQAKARMRR